jgi:uncharacterized protein YbjQ (UPF0145 family)
VRDAREAALDRLVVQQDLLGGDARLAQRFDLPGVQAWACVCIGLLSGLSGPS